MFHQLLPRLAYSFVSMLVLALGCHAQSVTYELNGTNEGDLAGFSVSNAGDVNGDGINDVIYGAFGVDTNGADAGSAQVVSGANGAILFTAFGDDIGDSFGFSVAGAGDVNNDGFDDVIVGALTDEVNGVGSGSARVLSGQDGSTLYTFLGNGVDDFFGVSVAGLGDINGDGFGDVMVGAFGDDNNGAESGSVCIFSGFDGSLISILNGAVAGDRFGASLSKAGDVDNDGVMDYIIGAPQHDTGGVNAGAAYVYSGWTGNLLYSFFGSSNDNFGVSVSDAGDLNKDGFADVIVGADKDDSGFHADNGSAVVFSGIDGSVLFSFFGFENFESFGFSVSAAGDFDGDSFDDVIVGAPQESFSLGCARIFSGRDGSILNVLNGVGGEERFGWSVADLGDINNDGLSDVVVGSPQFNDFGGSAPLLSTKGKVEIFATRTLDRINGHYGNHFFGWAVSGAGDVNGDGFDDVIASGLFAGWVRVYSGADGRILHHISTNDPTNGFGSSVSEAGDVNDDGFDDFIVGAFAADDNGTDSGSAIVYSGLDASVLYQFDGNSAGDHFGTSVSCAGDVDEDGFPDFIIGATQVGQQGIVIGYAKVMSGFDGSTLHMFTGSNIGGIFGSSVDGAGDLNGDGFDDLIVGGFGYDLPAMGGSPAVTDVGRAVVYSGLDGTVIHEFVGTQFGEFLGSSVSGAGDLDCDGFADVIVGASGFEVGTADVGKAVVYSGSDGSVMHTFVGAGNLSRFGASVDCAGDFNKDGTPDLVVGGLSGISSQNSSKAVRVFSGVDGSELASFGGDNPQSDFGISVRGAGDVNRDGFDDVIVGAPRADVNGEESGRVYVFYAEVQPTFAYDSELAESHLKLSWTPNGGDPQAFVGTLSCTGATPGAFGSFGTSLAPANLVVSGIPLLIAVDSTNLIDNGDFGFGFMGELVFPGLSRQIPALAGSSIFIQLFEFSPVLRSSNGVSLLLVP